MSIIDFRQDIRVDDYYRNQEIPKWVTSNKAYRTWLHNIGDYERLKLFNLEQKRKLNGN